jgi:hypothetical protein
VQNRSPSNGPWTCLGHSSSALRKILSETNYSDHIDQAALSDRDQSAVTSRPPDEAGEYAGEIATHENDKHPRLVHIGMKNTKRARLSGDRNEILMIANRVQNAGLAVTSANRSKAANCFLRGTLFPEHSYRHRGVNGGFRPSWRESNRIAAHRVAALHG